MSRPAMTEKRLKILKLMGQGYSNIEISNKLKITTYTVKAQITAIFNFLNVHTRVQAIVKALKEEIIVLDDLIPDKS